MKVSAFFHQIRCSTQSCGLGIGGAKTDRIGEQSRQKAGRRVLSDGQPPTRQAIHEHQGSRFSLRQHVLQLSKVVVRVMVVDHQVWRGKSFQHLTNTRHV